MVDQPEQNKNFTGDRPSISDPNPATISLITVVRNSLSLIEPTIQSVVHQTYRPLNYVIIDGASTDGTVNVIRDYATQYPDIIDWISEPDRGISEAFNKGIQRATGCWLNFLNAGDRFIHDHVLTEVSAYFAQGAIVTGFAQYGSDTIPDRPLHNSDPLPVRAKLSHQASFIHRQVFEQVGLYDESYTIRMDYEFWLRALARYDFVMSSSDWVNYDTHGLSGQGNYTRRFYNEEQRANRTHTVPHYRCINGRLNLLYYKDRLSRWIRRK